MLGIKHLHGWSDINFSNIKDIRTQHTLKIYRLRELLDNLESILLKKGIVETAIYSNPIDNTGVQTKNDDINLDNWKQFIPRIIKNAVPWDRFTIEMTVIFLKEILMYTNGKVKGEIEVFIKRLETIQKSRNKIISDRKRYWDKQPKDQWRGNIPILIKHFVKDWNNISFDFLRLEVFDLVDQSKGLAKNLFEDYLGVLDDLEMDMVESEDEYDDQFIYDPLEIIDRYKNGAIQGQSVETISDESWRKIIPIILKKQIKDWETRSITDVYNQAKEIMNKSGGKEWEIIMEFMSEISQIIFSQDDSDEVPEESENAAPVDEIEDSIMSLVEMIILPRLEVLDIIRTRGGNVTFANLWNKPFAEPLKKEVKDRDHWKCVVCENETDLHVHHKIPRNLGGIHHKENLVTLCASCHAAIETADIQHAFTKCLANYKRQKFSNVKNSVDISKDKKLLKDEVENSLDKLLIELSNKDEVKMMEDVMGIMKKLEIIFYG